MTRHEFTTAIKRAAKARSGGRCEGVGERYGKAAGERCSADLSVTGIQFDHHPLGAHAEGSSTLENCNCVCPACNQWAANHTDKAVEAKIKRVRRRHGLDPDKRKHRPKPIRSRGFNKGQRKIPSRPLSKKGRPNG